MNKILVVFTCLILVLGSCSRTGRDVNFNGEWITHEGTGYQLEYPDNWNVTTADYAGVDAIFMSPKEYSSDPFLENFNVVIQDVDDITLQEYTDLSLSQIENMINDAEIVANEENTINGNICNTLIYTGKPGAHHLQYRQDYYIVDGKAYVVTFTCEQDRYEDYLSISEEVFNSFKID